MTCYSVDESIQTTSVKCHLALVTLDLFSDQWSLLSCPKSLTDTKPRS
jgi:hypothetical protein